LRINILTNPHKRTKSLDALNKRFYRYKKILNLKKNNISGDKIQALANNYFLYKTVNAKKIIRKSLKIHQTKFVCIIQKKSGFTTTIKINYFIIKYLWCLHKKYVLDCLIFLSVNFWCCLTSLKKSKMFSFAPK